MRFQIKRAKRLLEEASRGNKFSYLYHWVSTAWSRRLIAMLPWLLHQSLIRWWKWASKRRVQESLTKVSSQTTSVIFCFALLYNEGVIQDRFVSNRYLVTVHQLLLHFLNASSSSIFAMWCQEINSLIRMFLSYLSSSLVSSPLQRTKETVMIKKKG